MITTVIHQNSFKKLVTNKISQLILHTDPFQKILILIFFPKNFKTRSWNCPKWCLNIYQFFVIFSVYRSKNPGIWRKWNCRGLLIDSRTSKITNSNNFDIFYKIFCINFIYISSKLQGVLVYSILKMIVQLQMFFFYIYVCI